MENIIELKNLSKDFKILNKKSGKFSVVKDLFSTDYTVERAVNQINLNIGKGEIVGFIGPNGAGKSTTIKMLTGVLVPTEGTVLVNGFIPYKHRVKYVKEIGVVMGQRSQLWWDLSVEDSFKVMKEMYELSDAEYAENMRIFEEELCISELFDKSVRHLSLGQKMLCEIVAVLLYNPKVIFLDEPTIGLDISVKTKIRKIIKRMNSQQGVTVILTTHDISDIEALCDRVVIIDHGTIIFDDSMNKMKQLVGSERKIIEITTKKVISDELTEKIKGMFTKEHLQINPASNKRMDIICDSGEVDINELLLQIMEYVGIEDINTVGVKIEDIVRQVYEGNLL
ncbi:ABC transporter ATP-binding protein [Anaerocolumna xylanovorans]|uniref:ABC-2 type transport system ATP-binding protein n=1 Tax=Anaerocolumna xylanovorans DSM 12503 TaxID=1121345 RepID=A0A1M7YF97_9FIRM|nr:ATP-binding cassette domain-containing protein [Anaerocolumna xylanovorans]SHO51314.1 ABC-2 type transport system ATP-binding protein [Anaerocolumna xylanovorans DSM 12503]